MLLSSDRAGLSGENPKESEFMLLAPDRGRGGERGVARDFASGPITATVFPSVDDFRHPAPPLPRSGERSMKNGDLVRFAQSFKGKKGVESHGNRRLMPLSDLSLDIPADRGRGA
jgi:hypothetical protein